MDADRDLSARIDQMLRQQAQLADHVSHLRDQVTRLSERVDATEADPNEPDLDTARNPQADPRPRRGEPRHQQARTLDPRDPGPDGRGRPGQPRPVADYDLPTMSRADVLGPFPGAGQFAGPQYPPIEQPVGKARHQSVGSIPPWQPGLTPPGQPAKESRSDGVLAKVMAFAGAGVLLIGVVLLLVLAAQAGWFGPVAQVTTAGVLAVALVGAAIFLRRRSAIGAIVLAGAGFATAFLTVAAITALHEWVSRPIGLGIAGAISLAGLGLARWWRSAALATLVSLGVLILVPVVSRDLTTTMIFALAFAIASLIVTWGLAWAAPMLARVVPLGLLAVLIALQISLSDSDLWLMVGSTVVLVLIALAEGVGAAQPIAPAPSHPTLEAAARSTAGPPGTPVAPGATATTAMATTGTLPVLAAMALPLLALPALILGVRLWDPEGSVLLIVLGLLLLGVSAPLLLSEPVRYTAAATAGVLLPSGITTAVDDQWFVVAGIATSLLLLGAAWLLRSRAHFWIGGVHAGFSLALAALVAGFTLLSHFDAQDRAAPMVVNTVAGIGVMVVLWLLLRTGRVPSGQAPRHRAGQQSGATHLTGLQVVMWAAATLLFSAAVVAVGTQLAALSDAAEPGFRIAHAVVTLCWFVLTGVALTLGLRAGPTAAARRGFGFGLAGIALLKLLVWDLSVLDGVVRVVAAIVAGLILIGLGIWYARALEKVRRPDQVDPSASSLATPLPGADGQSRPPFPPPHEQPRYPGATPPAGTHQPPGNHRQHP